MKMRTLLSLSSLLTPLLSWSAEHSLYAIIRGEYQGLRYSEEVPATHINSSYLSFKVANNGSLRGDFFLGGQRFRLNEMINRLGWAEVALTRGDILKKGDWELRGLLSLEFSLDGSSPEVHVEYSDLLEMFSPELSRSFTMEGYKAPFNDPANPAPQAGRYTFVLSTPETVPEFGGPGFGTVSIDSRGKVTFHGRVPDNRTFLQHARLGRQGQWPCYATPYGQAGSLIGWLNFSEDSAHVPNGSLVWTRPAGNPRMQPATERLQLIGSAYNAPASGERILDFTDGILVLSGPGLNQPLTNYFHLSSKQNAADKGSNRLNLTFNPRNGTFAGSVIEPLSRQRLAFKGAVVQSLNSGFGYYLLPDKRTGAVWLGASQGL